MTILEPLINKFVTEWYFSCPVVSQTFTLYFIFPFFISFTEKAVPKVDGVELL